MQNETPMPMMPEFAWDQDKLTTSDEAKLTKIVRKNLSASASNSLRGCTARFAADSVLPRMDDPFSPAELGTGAHAVLEELYALPPLERTKENLIRLSLELADKEWTPDKLTRHTVTTNSLNKQVKQEWEEKVRAMALGDFAIEDPTKIDVFQPEWALRGIQLPVPDGRLIPMVGFIDRTDFTPEGKLAIRDYKTGKYKAPNPRFSDDYGDQLRIYTVTAETVLKDPELRAEHFSPEQLIRLDEAGHYSVEDAKLLYTAAGKERVVDINQNARNVTMSGFASSWDKMQAAGKSGEFKATPSALCAWCPLVNSCPVAKVTTDKGRDAAKSQPSKVDLGIPVVRNFGHSDSVVDYSRAESAPARNETRDVAPSKPVQKEGIMAQLTNGYPYAEDSAYKEFVNYPDGARPNLNSYGFGGATGLIALSYELLSEHNAVSSQRIIALGKTLGKLVWLVERRLANSAFNWNHGLHTRLRGNLRTVIEAHPLPINGSADDWQTWVKTAAAQMADLVIVAYNIAGVQFTEGMPVYNALAADGENTPPIALPGALLPEGVAYLEGKVYEETVNYPDGSRENVNTHGFAGASGIVSEAYRLLHESNDVEYNIDNLVALSGTLSYVLWRAETKLVNAFNWNHGLHTRLRGFMFNTLKHSAPTLNMTLAAWADWTERSATQLVFLTETSYSLYNTEFSDVTEPYAPLTSQAG